MPNLSLLAEDGPTIQPVSKMILAVPKVNFKDRIHLGAPSPSNPNITWRKAGTFSWPICGR